MVAVFAIAYVTIIILIYKILKIRPNPKNVAAMVVLGVSVVGSIVILWKFSAPIANQLVVERYTVSLVPQVGGPIKKIHAEPNVPLKGGQDILFEIQPEPYQFKVDQLQESLIAARRTVDQLEAASIATDAAVRKAEAGRAAAEAEQGVAQDTAAKNPDAISKLALRQLTEQFNAADAGVDQAKATAVQAKIGQQAAGSTAQSLQAQLANAEFELKQCTVYAPADGFVTNWAAREGTMAVPMPLAALGTFVDTSQVLLVGNFPQNIATNIREGDAAELIFKSRPGEIFNGKVKTIVQATGEGQVAVSGNMPTAAEIGSKGMLAVKFALDDRELGRELAMGTAGSAAVYTQRGKPFHVMSKVGIRLKAWLYYLIPM